MLDIPFWSLGLKYPTRVSASGPPPDPQKSPQQMASQLEFPAADGRGPITLRWHQGIPPIISELKIRDPDKKYNNLFVGSKGMLVCGFEGHKLLPEERFKDVAEPDSFLPPPVGFYKEWFDACKGGPPASGDFSYGGPMTEAALLANVAYRVQGGFEWDAANLKIIGNEKAELYLRSHIRKGWEMLRQRTGWRPQRDHRPGLHVRAGQRNPPSLLAVSFRLPRTRGRPRMGRCR